MTDGTGNELRVGDAVTLRAVVVEAFRGGELLVRVRVRLPDGEPGTPGTTYLLYAADLTRESDSSREAG